MAAEMALDTAIGHTFRRQEPPSPSVVEMEQAAMQGLAGELVEVLSPHTEADPAGLLMTFLATFGSAVGAGPHVLADGSEHPARLFVVLVGRSARGRKGTSWANVRRVVDAADPEFCRDRVVGGLSSGEGLIAALADLRPRLPALDRSLLVHEPEFGRLLRVAARPGSTLSAVLRQAWDGGTLAVLTRKDPVRTDGAHVGLVAHVTEAELREQLSALEVANGLANRCLFASVRRSKLLPTGGDLPYEDLHAIGRRVRDALDRARTIGPMRRSEAAEHRWAELYRELADDDDDSIIGALTARAEAQILRLSVTYALFDASPTIGITHLVAAEAVWRYSEDSLRHVFGDGSDRVAARLVAGLTAAGARGLDGSEQLDLFARHLSAQALAGARRRLEQHGIIVTEQVATAGRPRLVSRLARHAVSSLSSQPEPRCV